MFLELTEILTCEVKTLAYTKAAILVFCLALAGCNGISVIKAPYVQSTVQNPSKPNMLDITYLSKLLRLTME